MIHTKSNVSDVSGLTDTNSYSVTKEVFTRLKIEENPVQESITHYHKYNQLIEDVAPERTTFDEIMDKDSNVMVTHNFSDLLSDDEDMNDIQILEDEMNNNQNTEEQFSNTWEQDDSIMLPDAVEHHTCTKDEESVKINFLTGKDQVAETITNSTYCSNLTNIISKHIYNNEVPVGVMQLDKVSLSFN